MLCEMLALAMETQLADLAHDLRGGAATRLAARPPPFSRRDALETPALPPKASFSPDGRFPPPNSRDSERLCGPIGLGASVWRRAAAASAQSATSSTACQFHVEEPKRGEGFAHYMDQVVNAGQRAAASGKHLHLSWPGANLSEFLEPASALDWRASISPQQSAHDCGVRRSSFGQHDSVSLHFRGSFMGRPVSGARKEESALFHYGPACIIGALLRPAQLGASFERTRAALADRDTLAIGIYIRTGDADSNHLKVRPEPLKNVVPCPPKMSFCRDRRTKTPDNPMRTMRLRYARALLCALQLERRWAAGFKRVVWFVASDRQSVKDDIIAGYDEAAIGGRRVLTAATAGLHTDVRKGIKFAGGVGGTAWRQALHDSIVDWWLLGEVDVAVLERRTSSTPKGGSYAGTAFARTARLHSVFEPPASATAFQTDAAKVGVELATSCDSEAAHLMMHITAYQLKEMNSRTTH